MNAGADDLPPELISRIVTFLAHALQYSRTKKGLGNCSLVCKYWARFLRAGLFRELTLETAEDGRQFHAFIEKPVTPQLSIKELVFVVHIKCDFAETPWLHHVFMPWNPHPNIHRYLSDINVDIINSSPTPSNPSLGRIPSIYRSIPRPPPPWRTPISMLSLRNVSFADLSYLSKFFASVGEELRAVTLENIHIEDVDKLCVSSPLRYRVHTKMDVTVSGGNAPVQLLRSLLPVRDRKGDYSSFIQPRVLWGLEQAILAIMWQTETTASRDDYSHISYFVRLCFEPSVGAGGDVGYDILFEGRSSGWYSTIEAIDAVLSNEGTLTRVSIMLGGSGDYASFPWRQIDETLWGLIQGTQHLVISFCVTGRLTDIMNLTCREMTNFMHARKLQFGYLDRSTGKWCNVLAAPVEQVEEASEHTPRRRRRAR